MHSQGRQYASCAVERLPPASSQKCFPAIILLRVQLRAASPPALITAVGVVCKWISGMNCGQRSSRLTVVSVKVAGVEMTVQKTANENLRGERRGYFLIDKQWLLLNTFSLLIALAVLGSFDVLRALAPVVGVALPFRLNLSVLVDLILVLVALHFFFSRRS